MCLRNPSLILRFSVTLLIRNRKGNTLNEMKKKKERKKERKKDLNEEIFVIKEENSDY